MNQDRDEVEKKYTDAIRTCLARIVNGAYIEFEVNYRSASQFSDGWTRIRGEVRGAERWHIEFKGNHNSLPLVEAVLNMLLWRIETFGPPGDETAAKIRKQFELDGIELTGNLIPSRMPDFCRDLWREAQRSAAEEPGLIATDALVRSIKQILKPYSRS